MMIWFDPAAWFWIPLLASIAVFSVLPATRSREAVITVGILSLSCLTLSFVGTVFWGWFGRDGLAPGMVQSHGITAVRRFLGGGTSVALFILLCVGSVVCWVCLRRLRRLSSTRS